MASGHTERTLARLRKSGYTAAVCEKWIAIEKHPGGGVRKDLFGFIDVLAFRAGQPQHLAVQSTSKPLVARHVRDYRQDPDVRQKILDWLSTGHRFEIWGWHKVMEPTKAGGTKPRWHVVKRTVRPEDLEEAVF